MVMALETSLVLSAILGIFAHASSPPSEPGNVILARRAKMTSSSSREVITNFIHQEMIRRAYFKAIQGVAGCLETNHVFKHTLWQFLLYQRTKDYWQKIDWALAQNMSQVLNLDQYWTMESPVADVQGQDPILLWNVLQYQRRKFGPFHFVLNVPFPSTTAFQSATSSAHLNELVTKGRQFDIGQTLQVFYYPLHFGTWDFCPMDCFENVEFCGSQILDSRPTQSPDACQKQCAKWPTCSYFTWKAQNESHLGLCSFYDWQAPCFMQSSSLEVLSGPRECSKRFFSFNFSPCPLTPQGVVPQVDKFQALITYTPTWFTRYDDEFDALRNVPNQRNRRLNHTSLDVPPVEPSCNLWGTALCGHNLALGRNIQAFQTCRFMCQAQKGCLFWTWNPESGLCFLKDGNAICGRRDTLKQDIVSGSKYCLANNFRPMRNPLVCKLKSQGYSECVENAQSSNQVETTTNSVDVSHVTWRETELPSNLRGTGKTQTTPTKPTKPPTKEVTNPSVSQAPKMETEKGLSENSKSSQGYTVAPDHPSTAKEHAGGEWIYEYDWVSVIDHGTTRASRLTPGGQVLPEVASKMSGQFTPSTRGTFGTTGKRRGN